MATQVRILFIGGKRKNVPESRLLCEWEQYEQDSSQLKRGEISFSKEKPFHIVLCFNDYIGHSASEAFRSKAKLLGIPFVGASGGFLKLLEAAMKSGQDLYPFVKSDTKPQSVPVADRVPSNPVIEWAKSLPRTAQARTVKDNVRVWAVTNRSGGESVLLKGKLLDDAVNFVKKKGLGSGSRGGLTPKESAKVVRFMEKQYGFSKRGLSLTPTTVMRNVGVVLGTLPDKVSKNILGKFGKGKKAARKAAVKATTLIKKKQEEAMSPEEKVEREKRKQKIVDEINGKSKTTPIPSNLSESELIQLFSSDISQSLLQIFSKHDALYEKIVELNRENASYIEHITRLEEERDKLTEKINELGEEVKKWKRMVI